MIFQPDFAELVLAGSKTQTRRRHVSGRACTYRVDRTYAVQDRRGGSQLGRIHVLAVELVEVGSLSHADARAEGFASPSGFWEWWEARYGDIRDQKCWRIEFEVAT